MMRDDFSIDEVRQEIQESEDTHGDSESYQKVGTAATLVTRDNIDDDTSLRTIAEAKVTCEDLTETNVSTIDNDIDLKDDEDGDEEENTEDGEYIDAEPTLDDVCNEYKQLRSKYGALKVVKKRCEKFTYELRGHINTQYRELDRMQSKYTRAME